MESVLKHSEYLQMFSTNSLSYLSSDISMGHYKTLDVLMLFSDNMWTSYIPKKKVEETLQEGLKILGDRQLFDTLKNDLEDYYKKADKLLTELLSHEVLSEENIKNILSILSENYKHYSKTEFFYTEQAYNSKDQNPVILENIAKLELLKNESRSKMNAIFYGPGAHRKIFLKKISLQFNIPLEHVSAYGMADILSLYSGVRLKENDILERESSYVLYSESNAVSSFQGEMAKEIIKNFRSAENINANTLKGIVVSKGKVTAPATLIVFGGNAFSRLSETISKMPKGNVLVADSTGPELIMACKKASAILTNQGGMMSHAAIVSRELNIPCIVGLKIATQVLKDGDMVEVDAEKGIVTIIS